MSQQQTITSYFGKRKRIGADDIRASSKKILLDDPVGLEKSQSGNFSSSIIKQVDSSRIGVITQNEKSQINIGTALEEGILSKTPTTERNRTSVREALKADKKLETKAGDAPSPVKFCLMGSLSPVKKPAQRKDTSQSNASSTRKIIEERTPVKEDSTTPRMKNSLRKLNFDKPQDNCSTDDIIKSANELVNKLKATQEKLSVKEKMPTKDISLKEIKEKIKQSSKLNELKKSINKINEQAAELMEIDKRKRDRQTPKLKKFEALEVEVPKSPHKSVLYSPIKTERSPVKPAYQRFAGLLEITPALPLPFGFQKLYEFFTATDTVCSMMVNRGETITFRKLKPAVEEMTRKNLTLRHIGQMATVYPDAFKFHQEKLRNFGSTSKVDRYELVITPQLPQCEIKPKVSPATEDENIIRHVDRMTMTPKILKARKEFFHKALLEKTKDHHEEFLKSLVPPVEIKRNELRRWHPNFMVDHVPDIIPSELPQPPHSERPSTAKDVLERAREFLSSNVRLQKALETASKCAEENEPVVVTVSVEVKKKVDSKLPNPLKGISKSLLERVRAKQAAKALETMKMTPQQEKETVMYARLPEIARIVRTLFVNEQKGVLSWELVSEKVQFSYNKSLSKGEVEAHVRLLVKNLPEWLSVVRIRNAEYLKMSREVNLPAVLEKLEKIVSEKKKL